MESCIKRINILGVPIDVVREEELPVAIESLYYLKEHRQIVLLGFHEFMLSRHNAKRKQMLQEAALVIPVSSLIVRAAQFLKKEVPPLRRPYSFIIRLLTILESRNKSVYLLGMDIPGVRAAEASIRTTFPGLQVVGRYGARFKKNREKDIITAIKKASPSLLLAGKGLRKKNFWIMKNRHQFTPGLAIWEHYCFPVFAGKRPKPNYSTGVRLLKFFFMLIIMPWRILLVFRYMYFFFLLTAESLRS